MKTTNKIKKSNDELIHPPIGIPYSEEDQRVIIIMIGVGIIIVGIAIISAFIGLVYITCF